MALDSMVVRLPPLCTDTTGLAEEVAEEVVLTDSVVELVNATYVSVRTIESGT